MSPRRRPRKATTPRYGGKLISSTGGTRKWAKTVKDFVKLNPYCWLRFPKCTIAATTIDHYHPMKTHPHLTDEPSNWRPACSYCNRARRHTPVHRLPELRIKLEAEFRTKQKRALGFFGS